MRQRTPSTRHGVATATSTSGGPGAAQKSLTSIIHLAVMLVAASFVVLTTQHVSMLGVHSRALATPLAQYSSDSLLGFLSSTNNGVKRRHAGRIRAAMFLIPLFDLTGCVLGFIGVERLGGSSFTTLFSANLVVTALFSRIFLGRRLSIGQILSISAVSVGVIARSSGAAQPMDAVGVGCTLLSAIVYALRSVTMEGVRASGKDAPSGAEIAARIGYGGLIAMSLWQVLYTYPNRHGLVLGPLRRSGAPLARVAGAFGVFMASRMFLVMMQSRVISGPFGATGAALVYSCRGALVSLLSSLFFCSVDPKECLSGHAAVCSVVIMLGGIGFSMSPPPPPKSVRTVEKKAQ